MTCQFSESERRGISNYECICIHPCFRKAGRVEESIIPHETPSLIQSLTQLFGEMPANVDWIVMNGG